MGRQLCGVALHNSRRIIPRKDVIYLELYFTGWWSRPHSIDDVIDAIIIRTPYCLKKSRSKNPYSNSVRLPSYMSSSCVAYRSSHRICKQSHASCIPSRDFQNCTTVRDIKNKAAKWYDLFKIPYFCPPTLTFFAGVWKSSCRGVF